jgi:hypothetical protein
MDHHVGEAGTVARLNHSEVAMVRLEGEAMVLEVALGTALEAAIEVVRRLQAGTLVAEVESLQRAR